jgi:hypothetical protein
MSYPHIMTDQSVSIVIGAKNYNFTSSHPNFNAVRDAIRKEQWDGILNLIDIPKAIETFAKGAVKVEGGLVTYNGVELHNVVTDRILRLQSEGFKFTPLVNFLEKLIQNPSRVAVEELYLFMESGALPLCEDGDFLAYKRVKDDYTDYHTGTLDNSVGKVVEMIRNAVDDRRDHTCSYGLHFCSRGYLNAMGSGRTVIVKINPRDVVAIPSDYSNMKGRTCRYEVIGELDQGFTHTTMEQAAYVKPAPEFTWKVEVVVLDENAKLHTDVIYIADIGEYPDVYDVREAVLDGQFDCFEHTGFDQSEVKIKSIDRIKTVDVPKPN